MLPEVGNMVVPDNKRMEEGLEVLRERLPAGWKLGGIALSRGKDPCQTAAISAPDGRRAVLQLAVKPRTTPRDIATFCLQTHRRQQALSKPANTLLVSGYFSPASRQLLREEGIGFVDLSGNVRLTLADPGLFIEVEGTAPNPFRENRPERSLKGAKAGRVVRELVDFRQVPGVRELAARAGVDPGYLSRVLAFLNRETLVARGARGRVERVDWAALLRRWAMDAPLESRGLTGTFIDPRGLPSVLRRLATCGLRYAVTGSLAASRIAPIASPRLAVVYVDDFAVASKELDLRPAEAGANILLIQSNDDIVFARAADRDGIRYAAVSQVAADLLTSPGRGPAEAEELLAWMAGHEEAWRG